MTCACFACTPKNVASKCFRSLSLPVRVGKPYIPVTTYQMRSTDKHMRKLSIQLKDLSIILYMIIKLTLTNDWLTDSFTHLHYIVGTSQYCTPHTHKSHSQIIKALDFYLSEKVSKEPKVNMLY